MDTVKYSSRRGAQIKGWISADGLEPKNALPLLELGAVNGAIKASIQTQRK
jgi:hypothetical protein